METVKPRTSTDTQESKTARVPNIINNRSSFHETVIRTQQLMRVLKTMHTIGEIKQEDVLGKNINIKQHHRRSATLLKKVTSDNFENSLVNHQCVISSLLVLIR
ncbi:unnamed protein product [Adineta steineri]|uniref:Uncharacterized protein n=1 Tax=Adineta steineri TaxID=433720 RepID=A0A814ZBZ3_9BILA|nr:unnamed protein product [Adineta steineri]CAF1243676.1 unnamed protein product [Adineta steineri]